VRPSYCRSLSRWCAPRYCTSYSHGTRAQAGTQKAPRRPVGCIGPRKAFCFALHSVWYQSARCPRVSQSRTYLFASICCSYGCVYWGGFFRPPGPASGVLWAYGMMLICMYVFPALACLYALPGLFLLIAPPNLHTQGMARMACRTHFI